MDNRAASACVVHASDIVDFGIVSTARLGPGASFIVGARNALHGGASSTAPNYTATRPTDGKGSPPPADHTPRP